MSLRSATAMPSAKAIFFKKENAAAGIRKDEMEYTVLTDIILAVTL